jgi:formylglycine-generating enzyme required for sulfatase activity
MCRAELRRVAGLALLTLVVMSHLAGAAPIDPPEVVIIPGGEFISGSNAEERELGYRLDERAYGHDVTRQQRWYEGERPLERRHTIRYAITRTPITNAEYRQFVLATGHRSPTVNESTWNGYGLVHPFERTRRHAWVDGHPPKGRERHPVVLVSWHDAMAYAEWLSRITEQRWRLPTESEWEKAVRGTDGRIFPWGDAFDATRLNSHDAGPFDTRPVGAYPSGASPYGIEDGAGQVFEWLDKPISAKRAFVKGGSWDDQGCGVCRPAARHARTVFIKHILIGFRLVLELRP